VHGFYAGNDWEFFRPIRPGDRVNCVERVVGVEEKESRFSGRLVMQYVEALFTNQRDELIAKTLGWCTRHERRAARETGKYRDVPTQHQYSDEEYARIDAAVLNEDRQIRGGDVRYWEDAAEGEALPAIARGPLSLMDTMGFLVGCGRGHTHGVVLKSAVRHPGHYFRNPEAGGGIEYTGIGHHRDSVAREVGVPGTYDYGPQRTAWLATLVTNWMGDDAILKRLRGELRRFNVAGDTTWITGTVSRKYVKDGYALVDIDIVGENQRGELTTKGLATVHLLSRDLNHRVALTGTDIDLGLPTVR
jgi:acyl dehydratase